METHKTEKVSLLEKIAYGSGDLASNLILVLTTTYVTFFYTDALGLSPAIIGTILMLSRFMDGFTDIFMGFIMDKTKSKHGKARAWLHWGAIPIGVATVLMFLVPNTGTVGKYIYVAITYNLVTTFLYTMINIPYGALTSLMTRDQDERMIINAFRMFMAQAGSLIINAMTLPLVNKFGGSGYQRSWIIVSIIYAVIAVLLFYFTFFNVKERVHVTSKKDEEISLKESLKIIVKNNYWLILVGIWVSLVFGMSMQMSVGTYYAKYILGDENYAGILAAIGIVPILLFMPIITKLNIKYGKRNVALGGGIINLIGLLMMLINPYSFKWLVFSGFIKGIGMATSTANIFAMVADTIEYGHWKTGTRVEGVLYSSTTFGAKVGAGIGGAVALSVLGKAGYDGLAAVQTESALNAIKSLYLYFPIPFAIIMIVLYMMYKLDDIYPTVIKELEERER